MQYANYKMMVEIYENLNKTLDAMFDDIKNAKKIVDKMDSSDHWDCESYKHYDNKFDNMYQNFGAYLNEMYELNTVIKQAAERYKTVDKEVTGR